MISFLGVSFAEMKAVQCTRAARKNQFRIFNIPHLQATRIKLVFESVNGYASSVSGFQAKQNFYHGGTETRRKQIQLVNKNRIMESTIFKEAGDCVTYFESVLSVIISGSQW